MTKNMEEMVPNMEELHYKQPKNPEEYLVSVNLLPKIRNEFGSLFTILELPEVMYCQEPDIDHPSGVIGFKKYEGRTFNDLWNEFDGGCNISLDLIVDNISLIKDLLKIDIEYVLNLNLLQSIENYSFNLERWISEFEPRVSEAEKIGFSKKDLVDGFSFIKLGFINSKKIFSNGDLYPRNLIKTKNSLVLIDWEYRTDGRVFYIDYIENVIAFIFVHMWGNPSWQTSFLQVATKEFDLTKSNLTRAILIKSLSQSFFFHKHHLLTDPQIKIFKRALLDIM